MGFSKGMAGWAWLGTLLLIGCQVQPAVSNRRLIEHQALIDFSGLDTAAPIESLKIVCASPHDWYHFPLQRTPLFAHQQWRSPSTYTGMGVVCIRLPIPVSAKTLLWFAKREYTNRADDGRLIDEWDDALGRSWFEAENNRYHVRGYAVASGFSAWIVYFGYKINYPMNPSEISLAARAVETVVPLTEKNPPSTPGVPQRGQATD